MKPKRHRHSRELDIVYGYASMSGWSGIGACYYCKSCHEVLWFEDDLSSNFPKDIKHNDKKRKKNKRYSPNKDLIGFEDTDDYIELVGFFNADGKK